MKELMRRRLFVMLVAAVVAFTAISLRLADVQVFAASGYNSFGRRQDTRVQALPGLRGALMDRRGALLAVTEQQPIVIADPYLISHPRTEAASLARLLDQPAARISVALRRPSGYVQLGPVSAASASELDKLALPGITIQLDARRVYPAGQLARPLIGAVDAGGTGSSGLELAYNQALTGRPGRLVQRVDPQGRPVPGGTIVDRAALPGDDIVLSLDRALQYQTEQALGQALVTSHARSGIAMVMDTHTGGLLAVADLTRPGPGSKLPPALPVSIGASGQIVAPGQPGATSQPVESAAADAFTQVYEPGSVEKLVTVSAGLATGAISSGQTFDIPSVYNVDGTAIHDAEGHGTERLTTTGIVAQSSNIGAVQIAQRTGAESIYQYLDAFGMGQITPVHFPGESAGLIEPLDQVTPVDLATIAYGEGMAVTAAQVTSAYNTIADQGTYVAPHLARAVIGPHGHERPLPEPPPRRVVTASVARQMTAMFEQVVSAGTGRNAAVAGYAVAGKTGTAQYRGAHGYVAGYTVASFAGYAPAQDPAVTVTVMIDHTADYGAQAAAPAFSVIMGDALRDLAIPPDGSQPGPTPAARPVAALSRSGPAFPPAEPTLRAASIELDDPLSVRSPKSPAVLARLA